MKHLGDITKISGYSAPPVNVIIGGSPCQDLSVAGKRAGLAGERSGLFMEQIRLIKEMRENDERAGRSAEFIRPRFMVWENVPGAFSSNKGEDFRAVLEETARVVDKTAVIPRSPRGKWSTSGAIVGDGWNIAWRVLDAQFWGVPQRRRRIALVADFGGCTAPEILFEREGMSGDFAAGRTPRETSPRPVEGCPGKAGTAVVHAYCIQGNCIDRADTAGCNGKGWKEGVSYTLNTIDRHAVASLGVPLLNDQGGSNVSGDDNADVAPTLRAEMHGNIPAIVVENHPVDSRVKFSKDNVVQALSDRMGNGGGNVPLILSVHQNASGEVHISEKAYTIGTNQNASGRNTPLVMATGQTKAEILQDVAPTLNCNHEQPIIITNGIVRRLTPLECERLQGFPDGWTDIGKWTDSKGKAHKTTDSARYKALGNSIAIPPWFYVLQKLSLCCGSDLTMASPFDGIGGFPLIWETLNGKGSCLWASEIEEFPMAVTKVHFPDKE